MSTLSSIVVYMLTFAISMIISKLYQNYSIRKNDIMPKYKRVIWFLFIIAGPVFVSSIRYDVGTDYFAYIRWFDNINSLPLGDVIGSYGKEPLYLILNKVAFLLFKEPWGIFLLSSFLIHIFVIAGIDFFKAYLNIPMALFIYYMYHFSYGLNIMRQMIAIAIIFYSLKYIYKKQALKYILLVIIASMFHNSAMISLLFYVVVYFLYNNNLNNKVKKILYYITILLSPVIVYFGIEILIKIPIFARYERFIYDEVDLGIGFLISIIPIILPIFIFRKQILTKNRLFEPFIYLLLLNIPFSVVGYIANWGGRIALYTRMFYYILPPILVNSLYIKNNRRVIELYYVIYFLLYYFVQFVIVNNTGEVFPYNTIFGR